MAGKDSSVGSRNPNSLIQLVLVILLIGAAFFIGMLWTKLQTLEDNGTAVANNAKALNNGDVAGAERDPPGQPEMNADDLVPLTDDDWLKGNRSAKVVLFEYSDFECPYCQKFHPTAEQMLEEYGDDVAWVFRQFPLDSIHPNARELAITTECAGKLGGNDAFWVFTDAYMNGTNSESAFLASEAGINLSELDSCVENEETNDLVDEDLQGGMAAGIQGTPGNILFNTDTGEAVVVPGAVPFTMLKSSIDGLLNN